jgi:hypothetical protein
MYFSAVVVNCSNTFESYNELIESRPYAFVRNRDPSILLTTGIGFVSQKTH